MLNEKKVYGHNNDWPIAVSILTSYLVDQLCSVGFHYTSQTQIVYTLLCLFIPFAVGGLTMDIHPRLIESNRSMVDLVASIAFGLGMIPPIASLTTLLSQKIHLVYSLSSQLVMPTTKNDFFWFFLAYIVVPPFVEEFVYRGVLLQYLRRLGDRQALVLSALLFAMSHQNPIQSIGTFLLGLVLGYIALTTGSLLPGIIIHLMNNYFAIYGISDNTFWLFIGCFILGACYLYTATTTFQYKKQRNLGIASILILLIFIFSNFNHELKML